MIKERRTNTLLLGGLCAALVLFVVFAPTYGARVRSFFAANRTPLAPDGQNVAAENEVLKAQLAELATLQAELPTSTAQSVRAMVYSQYPFGFKNELMVNAGANQGVTQGDPVLYRGVLVGQVTQVWNDGAAVQTIFDTNLRMPVRIGVKGYDGLLEGGLYPVVGSVAKNADVVSGDVVYAAVAGLPYGLPVAEVQSTSTSADSLFQQASLSFAYDINQVQTVLIQKTP